MNKKGKGKDDKKKKEKVIVGPPAEESLNENNKGYYINLIRNLEQQVMTYVSVWKLFSLWWNALKFSLKRYKNSSKLIKKVCFWPRKNHFQVYSILYRYQQNCEELDVANAENQIKLDRMLDDQNDVVLFIENKLKNKG